MINNMPQRTQISIEDYVKKFDIPDEYQFIGFAVHHENRDDFLHSYDANSEISKRTWSTTPELAKVFDHQIDAENIITEINDGSVVALLFDADGNIGVIVNH